LLSSIEAEKKQSKTGRIAARGRYGSDRDELYWRNDGFIRPFRQARKNGAHRTGRAPKYRDDR
jgi:hypothetical protein